MQFKAQTIVPGGRFKYGEYLAAGNVTNKVTKTIYGGNGTTEDLGGDTNTGGDTGGTENITWQLLLSKGSYAFDGQVISALGQQSADTSVIGLLGTEAVETYVGDVTGDHLECSADTNGWETCWIEPLPPTSSTVIGAYDYITGMPDSGMTVTVTNNGDTGTTITVTIDSTLPSSANTGTLQIPCAVSLLQNQELGNEITDWELAYQEGKVMTMTLEWSWSVSSNASTMYRLDLSNDSGSINCDDDGHVLTGATRPSCEATLYFGQEPYTAATYGPLEYNQSQNVVGLASHTSNGVLYIDYDSPTYFDFDGDHLDITVKAYASSVPVGTKVFTITKSLPSEGHPATSYWMVFNSSSVKVNPNTSPVTVTPTAITAEVMMQVGQDTPTAATGCDIYYGYTTSPGTSYPNTGVTVDVSKEALYFVAKKGNVIVDGVEQIPILKDGEKGSAGESAYRLDLNNQSASINCDSSGNILTGAVRPTCTAKLYLGTTACTGVSYSISSGSCSYSGVSINSSTGVITFNPGTASTPFWFDTNYTSLALTIDAKINNTLYGSAIMNVSRSIAGSDGRSITGVTEWYALNNNSSNAPTSGWSTTLSNPTSGTPFLWNYEEIHYSAGSATTTDPVIIARYTKDGKGISAITEYYLINNSSASTPSTALTSWTTTLQVPTDSNPYLWNYEKITYTDSSTAATTPVIIGIKGGKGADAVSYWLVLDADEIKLTTADTFSPATITASAYKQVGENTPVVASDATIKWGYDTASPSTTYSSTITVTGTSHNYITFQLLAGGVVRDTETVLILRDGKDGTGTQGRQGAAIRGPIDWYDGSGQSGRRWCNGVLTDNAHPEDASWIDVIVKDGTYYYCNTSYTEAGQPWSAVSSNWTSADTEFDFVATNILLANNAKINFLSGNEIYMMDSSNTGVTAGVAGGEGISFWAGSDTPGDAPFQVNYDGSIKATSGIFSGYIQMPYTFVANLNTDIELSASTVGTLYLSQTHFLGRFSSAPSSPATGDSYYNTSYSPGRFYYCRVAGSWTFMTRVQSGGSDVIRGYIADNRAYLIADSTSGNYGMGDGGMLVLPEPSVDLNGFTYHILVVGNPATRVGSENPGISVMAANSSSAFSIYCYAQGIKDCKRLSFYGGHVEMTCVPEHDGNNNVVYRWAVTQTTGGVDCYSGTTSSDFVAGYSTICGYSTVDSYNCITKIKADGAPDDTKHDTLYITRS